MSRYSLHVEKWLGCTDCELSSQRSRMVFARGKVPCDVCFVGEAPGDAEDSLGEPFRGPAGHELDEWIVRAVALAKYEPRMAFGNLVCCFPREAKESKENRPPDEAIIACRPRLIEFIKLAQPRLLVAVGSLVRDWLDPKKSASLLGEDKDSLESINRVHITHPSHVLSRMNSAQKVLARKRIPVLLASAFKKLR